MSNNNKHYYGFYNYCIDGAVENRGRWGEKIGKLIIFNSREECEEWSKRNVDHCTYNSPREMVYAWYAYKLMREYKNGVACDLYDGAMLSVENYDPQAPEGPSEAELKTVEALSADVEGNALRAFEGYYQTLHDSETSISDTVTVRFLTRVMESNKRYRDAVLFVAFSDMSVVELEDYIKNPHGEVSKKIDHMLNTGDGVSKKRLNTALKMWEFLADHAERGYRGMPMTLIYLAKWLTEGNTVEVKKLMNEVRKITRNDLECDISNCVFNDWEPPVTWDGDKPIMVA